MIIFSNRNDWTAFPSGHHIACRRLKKEGVAPTKKFESRHKEGLNQDVSFERTSSVSGGMSLFACSHLATNKKPRFFTYLKQTRQVTRKRMKYSMFHSRLG
ncbi:Uncharacterized protein APZ42_026561 [Daphnia magna]|uniref:Uncharacterized protein n=1 Tax=Daphnia magna TaxID=35525 RepID=A0A162DAU2_9CRUS|nr:Uncharacterized protein APZ42_026561 [Daphnia magna]